MTGHRLKEALAEMHIEQAEVARKIGLTPQAFSNRLNAKQVKVDFIQQIEKAINRTVYDAPYRELPRPLYKQQKASDTQADWLAYKKKIASSGRPLTFTFEANFMDKIFYDIGTVTEAKLHFEQHYKSLSEFLSLPAPTVTLIGEAVVDENMSIESISVVASFKLLDVDYSALRAYEDIFKSIAYYKSSIHEEYYYLDFKMNVYQQANN